MNMDEIIMVVKTTDVNNYHGGKLEPPNDYGASMHLPYGKEWANDWRFEGVVGVSGQQVFVLWLRAARVKAEV